MTAKSVLIKSENLYRAVWRWHFYAGLYVIPFLFVLAFTGMLMLVSKPIDSFSIRHLSEVRPEGSALKHQELLDAVEKQFPHKQVKIYLPSRHEGDAARFSLVDAHGHHGGGHHAPGLMAFVNPYTAEVLGSMDPAKTLYSSIKNFHGSLYLGNTGDTLIEIAAGLTVLMILSGLYLAWPGKRWQTKKAQDKNLRARWKNLHRIAGLIIAIPLLFFLLSGLAWTNIWGGKFVQAWSSLPGTRFENEEEVGAHQAEELHHKHLNHEGHHQVPWAMEQTPLPNIGSAQKIIGIDTAIEIARKQGFENLRVHLPVGDKKVWTISATTIAGDLSAPNKERTLHLAPDDGRVLADHKFTDYPLLGKAMATFIPLHSGELGLWNLLLNLVLCAIVVFMIASGITLWWKRRPKGSSGTQAPIAPQKASAMLCGIMILISLIFPLTAAVLIVIAILDVFVLSKISWFKQGDKIAAE